jgi:hypothetical protein
VNIVVAAFTFSIFSSFPSVKSSANFPVSNPSFAMEMDTCEPSEIMLPKEQKTVKSLGKFESSVHDILPTGAAIKLDSTSFGRHRIPKNIVLDIGRSNQGLQDNSERNQWEVPSFELVCCYGTFRRRQIDANEYSRGLQDFKSQWKCTD